MRAVFFAFDLGWLDGVDLRQTPLIERKKKFCTRSTSSATANCCLRKCATGTLREWSPRDVWAFTPSTAGSRLRMRSIRRQKGGRTCSKHSNDALLGRCKTITAVDAGTGL